MGSWKLKIFMKSGREKLDIPKKSGVPGNCKEMEHLKKSGVPGNSGFLCYLGKMDIRKNWGYLEIQDFHVIREKMDFWKNQGCPKMLNLHEMRDIRDIRKIQLHISEGNWSIFQKGIGPHFWRKSEVVKVSMVRTHIRFPMTGAKYWPGTGKRRNLKDRKLKLELDRHKSSS